MDNTVWIDKLGRAIKSAEKIWIEILSKRNESVSQDDMLSFEKAVSKIEFIAQNWREDVKNPDIEDILIEVQDNVSHIKEAIYQSVIRSDGSISKSERKIINDYMTKIDVQLNNIAMKIVY